MNANTPDKESPRSVIAENFHAVKEEYRSRIFYGNGELSDAEAVLIPLCEQAFGKTDKLLFDFTFDLYVDIWSRVHSTENPLSCTPDAIKKALAKQYFFLPTEDIGRCVDAALEIIFRNEPELRSKIELLSMMLNFVQDHADENDDAETQHTEDDDYGLCREKPVFVAGFGAGYAYMESLQTADGRAIEYDRLGSTIVEGISGPVDIYEVKPAGGGEATHIYLCNYGKQNATRAPKGFRLA